MKDADYHERRAAEERERAAAAKGRLARDVHIALAQRHDDLAWALRLSEANASKTQPARSPDLSA